MLVYKIGAHKQMKRLSTVTVVTLAVTLFALLAATPANAVTITQAFNETGVTYNSMQALVFGADFLGTGINSVTPGTWTPVLHNSHWAVATDGNVSTTNENFNASFNTTGGNGYLDLYAF